MSVEPEHEKTPHGETTQPANTDPTLEAASSPTSAPSEPSSQEQPSAANLDEPTANSAKNNPQEGNVGQGAEAARPRIKIGTQRPGVAPPKLEPRSQIAYKTSPKTPQPADPQKVPQSSPHQLAPTGTPSARVAPVPSPTQTPQSRPAEPAQTQPGAVPAQGEQQPAIARKAAPTKSKFENIAPASGKVEPPNLRQALSPELEEELQQALGDATLDELIAAETAGPVAAEGLEPETRLKGRVLRVFRDNVFVDLGGRNQGVLAFHQLPSEPEIGAELDVVVNKFNVDDGLYELSLTGASVDVGDWSDISEGITVDARITGHNKGGLECEVNKIRGFIPAGQISIYRVENFEEFVGQTWPCVVVEAKPDRRNLVLSRRAVLEREQAEAKKQLLEQIQAGDVREGIVRSIRDFGAFVDLGGVDGLVHVSQMSWDRVKHPSEVLEVGQRVKVKVQKIDPDTQKISLAYRDLFENPWVNAAAKYPVSSKVQGAVSKIMDFGAFVKLEPGIEGLVHISELSHKRVFRVGDVVKEGDTIEAKVLSVDTDAQRISLSMRALEARPEPPKKAEQQAELEAEPAEPEAPRRQQPQKPLKGGLGRSPMGEKFGLRW